MFEGIALNIPLLATIPEGEVKQIIEKYSPSSLVVSDNSARSVADNIEEAMELSKKKNGFKNNKIDEFLASFSRESLSRQALEIFESLLLKEENEN